MNTKKIMLAKEMLEAVEESLKSVRRILNEMVGGETWEHEQAKHLPQAHTELGDRVVEGIFDGENMVDGEGKIYRVAPNYSSKSKLVEGDHLKLTIKSDGSFLFKQVGPIERRRVIGTLMKSGNDCHVTSDGKAYKVLLASVTYFRGASGDEVVLLVPKERPSKWGAVENIIKAGPKSSEERTDSVGPLPVIDTASHTGLEKID